MVDEAVMKFKELQRELESLTYFSHDNMYVGRLIADRILWLQNEINFYKMMIASRT
jgi:hypothetical protein